MQILWCTDVHLNFLPQGGARAFGEYIRKENPDASMAVVTGDIAEAPNFDTLIEQFAIGLELPVHFVLGNHDAYRGSIADMKKKAARMKGKARYLPASQLVEIIPGVALVGTDGWYDGRFGDAVRSNVIMSDWMYIKELTVVRGDLLRMRLKEIADAYAVEGRGLIDAAIAKGYTKLIFATHVPPFWEAAWHEGETSDKHWLPWMSSKAMGDMLRSVAAEHPEVFFLTLCGHTHGEGRVEIAENLIVMTGHSAYRAPRVCGVFDF
jgi:predicted phosphohydrolase